MRNWKQRLWSLLLCAAMLVSLCVTAEAVEVVDSGEFPGIDGSSPLAMGAGQRRRAHHRPWPNLIPQANAGLYTQWFPMVWESGPN